MRDRLCSECSGDLLTLTVPGATSVPTLVSVVMPARNAQSMIATQVEALLGQNYAGRWELVIVDNDSKDQTAAVALRVLASTVRPLQLERAEVVRYTERRGYASPRNFGVSMTAGAFIALCDADDRVDPSWLAALVRAGTTSPLVASRQMSLGTGSCSETEDDVLPKLPVKMGLVVAHTGGMGISRDLFERLEGFDPAFDLGGEDVDLSFRAWEVAGVEPILATTARYYVVPRPSGGSSFRQGFRNGRSQVRIYARHRSLVDEPSSGPSIIIRRFARLAKKLPLLVSPEHRKAWSAVAGWSVGRSVWSIRLRVPYF